MNSALAVCEPLRDVSLPGIPANFLSFFFYSMSLKGFLKKMREISSDWNR